MTREKTKTQHRHTWLQLRTQTEQLQYPRHVETLAE